MLFLVALCALAIAYCGAYAFFCIRQGPPGAAISACVMALLPAAALALSLL